MFVKNLRAGLAAVAVALMLTGCGTPAIADETVAVKATTPVTIVETIPPTEPAEERFEFGDVVWVVRRCTAGEDASLTRCRVVAQAETFVVVVPMWGPDMDQFRENLTVIAELPYDEFAESNCLELVLGSNCYTDRFEAEAAVDAWNGG